MLLGEFEHTIDDKSRLTLPAKFREALSGGLVITRGLDRCLHCYPEADWEQLVESRRGRGMFINAGARNLLLQGERHKFLAEQWPGIQATIKRLGLTAQELLAAAESGGASTNTSEER